MAVVGLFGERGLASVCKDNRLDFLRKDSKISVNVTFLIAGDSPFGITKETINYYTTLASAMNVHLNHDNMGPYIGLNLGILDLNYVCSVEDGTYYIIIDSKGVRSGSRIEYNIVSEYRHVNKNCTLLFNGPTVLVSGIGKNDKLSLNELSENIMPMLWKLIKVPINEYTFGNTQTSSVFELYDSNNKAKVCNGKMFRPCNDGRRNTTTSRFSQYKIDRTCGIEYLACNTHPSMRPASCKGAKISETGTACVLSYQKSSDSTSRPVIIPETQVYSTEVIQIINSIIVPVYNCSVLFRVYVDDKYIDLIKQAIKNINENLLNYHIEAMFVNYVKLANLPIEVKSCSGGKLGTAYNSIFSRLDPKILLCSGSMSGQLIETVMHELMHLLGLWHEKDGLMKSVYDPLSTAMNKYIINMRPDKRFEYTCTYPTPKTKLVKKKIDVGDGMALYTDNDASFLGVRFTRPISSENILSYPTIEDVGRRKIIELKSSRAYRSVVDAYHDSPSDAVYISDFRYESVPSVSVCSDIPVHFCTLVVSVFDATLNKIVYVNVGTLTGIYRINNGKCYIGCMNGIQLFHPKCIY